MNKLEKAVNCLIKAASRVHPLIHALKVSQPKPPRKPRTRRPKMYDGKQEAAEALEQSPVTEEPKKASEELTSSIIGTESKRKHYTKGSQEAKDFMNMLRRKGKK